MGFFDKIFSGLTKTRTNMEELEELFKNYKFESDDFYEELEDLLVMSDIGAETTDKVIEKMRLMCFDRNQGLQGKGMPDGDTDAVPRNR